MIEEDRFYTGRYILLLLICLVIACILCFVTRSDPTDDQLRTIAVVSDAVLTGMKL